MWRIIAFVLLVPLYTAMASCAYLVAKFLASFVTASPIDQSVMGGIGTVVVIAVGVALLNAGD